MSTPVWFPTDPASTNVGRFMAAHGIARYEDLERRSVEDPEWFWDAVVKFIGIDFPTPYRQVLDVSDGIPWARWFVGGKTNFAH
ncbi:MAG: AMP-dependent synthetase, partial [Acidimicrobiia bacterium]|nr:AMP-dependent synthetase [Acidimicrobiia bacterium]